LLTAPQARLTITKCFSRRLCVSAVQSFDFVFNVAFWLLTVIQVVAGFNEIGYCPLDQVLIYTYDVIPSP
jgi:hypothetical protein